jgi:hypothetical protein
MELTQNAHARMSLAMRTVKYLLVKGIMLDGADMRQSTPTHAAAEKSYIEIFEPLGGLKRQRRQLA